MKKWTRVGLIVLIMGISLLAGTIYRSNITPSLGIPRVDLAPNGWGPVLEEKDYKINEVFHCFFSPRDVYLEVQATAPVSVYILDSDGITQWDEYQSVDACWSFDETAKLTSTLHIPKRDKYTMLLYNPTDENVTAEYSFTVYGVEQDLLYASGAIIIAGLVFTTGSIMITKKRQLT